MQPDPLAPDRDRVAVDHARTAGNHVLGGSGSGEPEGHEQRKGRTEAWYPDHRTSPGALQATPNVAARRIMGIMLSI